MIPTCLVHDWFHIYCPGCGGTRAVKALVQLHFLKSLYYNPLPVLLILYGIFLIFTILRERSNGQRGRYGKWRLRGLLIVIGIYIFFGIMRDVLLVCFGVDMLGDF